MRIPFVMAGQGQQYQALASQQPVSPIYFTDHSDVWRAIAAVGVAVVVGFALLSMVGVIAHSNHWGDCNETCFRLWRGEQNLESQRIEAVTTRDLQDDTAAIEIAKVQAAAQAARAQAAASLRTGPLVIQTQQAAPPPVIVQQTAAPQPRVLIAPPQHNCCAASFGPIGVPYGVVRQRQVYTQPQQGCNSPYVGGFPNGCQPVRGYGPGHRVI